MQRLEELEKRIAALEKEQLIIKEYIKENIKSDEALVELVKKLRKDLGLIEGIEDEEVK